MWNHRPFLRSRSVGSQDVSRRASAISSPKLLARRPIKRLGAPNFGPVLAACRIALIVVEDDESLALVEQQLHASDHAPDKKPNRYDWRGKKGTGWAGYVNRLRVLKLTAEQRRASASRPMQKLWGVIHGTARVCRLFFGRCRPIRMRKNADNGPLNARKRRFRPRIRRYV
jgi:hypothetical protein